MPMTDQGYEVPVDSKTLIADLLKEFPAPEFSVSELSTEAGRISMSHRMGQHYVAKWLATELARATAQEA